MHFTFAFAQESKSLPIELIELLGELNDDEASNFDQMMDDIQEKKTDTINRKKPSQSQLQSTKKAGVHQ